MLGFQHYRKLFIFVFNKYPPADHRVLSTSCSPVYPSSHNHQLFVGPIILSFYLSYRYHYRFNTCYFHTCQQIHKPKNVSYGDNLISSHIRYDAFVSYASDDHFWVHNVLLPQLEGTYCLKLQYWDFPAHGDLVDVIIKKSSKAAAGSL